MCDMHVYGHGLTWFTFPVARMKKDLTRKDTQHDNKTRQLKADMYVSKYNHYSRYSPADFLLCSDQCQADRRRYEDRLKGLKETETKAIVRATNAEVSG